MAQTSPAPDRRSFLRGSVTFAGVAVALPTFAALSGCSAPTLDGKFNVISAVSDRIIPATDTGGAIAAKVPEYIAAVFEQHFTKEQQSEFADGLALLADTGIADASVEAQDKTLTAFANAEWDSPERAIFQQLHDMTVFGYYTSEVATQELAYEEIPGRYDGCVPLAEVGRAWLDRGV